MKHTFAQDTMDAKTFGSWTWRGFVGTEEVVAEPQRRVIRRYVPDDTYREVIRRVQSQQI